MPSATTKRALLHGAEIVTIGLPFCVFKLVMGAIALRAGGALAAVGAVLIVLGAIDLAINLGNLLSLAARRQRSWAVCLSHLAARRLGDGSPSSDDVGIAIDIFVSFGLVAIYVGFALFTRVEPWVAQAWNAAVVLNVAGAGIARLTSALAQRASASGDAGGQEAA